MLTYVKRLRLEKGIKAIDLAREIGVSPSYITLIEQGRVPSKKIKKMISKLLDVPIKNIW